MSDGLGAIYPAIMNCIIAMRCLGYSLDDPHVIRAIDEFEKLGIEEGDRLPHAALHVACMGHRLRALRARRSRRIRRRSSHARAAEWMLKKQVTHNGDWAVKVKNVAPAGWYFEFNNEFYPDVDDSAMVMLGLTKVNTPRRALSARVSAARHRLDPRHAVQQRRLGVVR